MNKTELDRIVKEQKRNDRFVKICRGIKKSDKLQQIWNNFRYDGQEKFKLAARREGYTVRQINAFSDLQGGTRT